AGRDRWRLARPNRPRAPPGNQGGDAFRAPAEPRIGRSVRRVLPETLPLPEAPGAYRGAPRVARRRPGMGTVAVIARLAAKREFFLGEPSPAFAVVGLLICGPAEPANEFLTSGRDSIERGDVMKARIKDRKSTRLNSSHQIIS